MTSRQTFAGLLFIMAATVPMFFFPGGWSLVFLAAIGLIVSDMSRLLPVLALLFAAAVLFGPH